MNPVTKALYHDFKTIAYRPELRVITNSVTATILLQQVFFRWVNNEGKPFYKFKEPCNHKLYKPGDSWCEELGFSRAEFDTAWKALAATGIASKKTNMERLTYYTLHESAFDDAVNAVYSAPSKRDIPALRKETFQRHVKTDSSVCSYTEITPEITPENTKEDHFEPSHPSPDGCSQTPNKFGVNANAEAELQRENEKTLSEELVECYQDAASQHAAYAEYLASKETKPKRKKPTKQPKRAMFASQVKRKEYPHTYAALLGLEAIIAAKPDHNIWVDGMTGRPMIQTAHIEQVEGNLAALAEEVSHLSSSNDDRIQMMNSAIHDLYLSRGHLREAGTVDLAFLAGVGMKHPHDESEMDAGEYAEWLVGVVY